MDKEFTIEELIHQAANMVRSGNLNLDISFHTNIEGNPRWIVSIEPPALPWEKIKKCGSLTQALKEAIDATNERWIIPKVQ